METGTGGRARDPRYEKLLEHVRARGVPEHWAEHAIVAVVHALELRVSGGEAEDLEAELPYDLRKALRHLHRHGHTGQPQLLTRDAFFNEVAGPIGLRADAAEPVVRTVFEALRPLLSPKESDDIAAQLPADLQGLWLGHPFVPKAPERPPDGYAQLLEDLRRTGALGGVVPEQAVVVVLGTLEQRLSGGEARRLSEHLPRELREQLRGREPPVSHEAPLFEFDELVHKVAVELALDDAPAKQIVRAVFAAVGRRLDDDERAHVGNQLPRGVREAWTHPGVALHA